MNEILSVLRLLLSALIPTIVIESVPLLFFSPRRRWLSVGLLCNVLTNPLLNCLQIVFYLLWPNTVALWSFILILELLVVWGEAWFYRNLLKVTSGKALMVSLLCNALSFGLGLLLYS
jgi:hypothetical protein